MAQRIDMVGKRYGRLIGIRFSHLNNRGKACWIFRCDCGKEKTAEGQKVRAGEIRSCGCLHTEFVRKLQKKNCYKHGKSNSPEWRAHQAMLNRCFNPNVDSYQGYGGRGITVCNRWLDFMKFYEDMGPRPSARHSLDRIDNDKGYYPENCRWATPKQQINNRRTSQLVTFHGQTMNLRDWAKIINVKPSTLYGRLNRYGWSVQKTLTRATQKSLEDILSFSER